MTSSSVPWMTSTGDVMRGTFSMLNNKHTRTVVHCLRDQDSTVNTKRIDNIYHIQNGYCLVIVDI